MASAQRVLARQDGPTVLIGHSFSGMIVTEAGVHPNVSALVYVAARAPDAGEDYTALARKFPAPPASAGIIFDGDEGRLSEAAFLRDFAGDLPEAKAKVLYAVQEPFHKALLAGRTTHAAWRSKPSFYAVSTEDRTINPDLEQFMAKRMGARTIEVKSSHLSLISHPDEITESHSGGRWAARLALAHQRHPRILPLPLLRRRASNAAIARHSFYKYHYLGLPGPIEDGETP